MSQDVFDTIDPAISGTDLLTELDGFKEAIMSGFSGTTRPTETLPGGYWVDTTNDPTSWSYRLYTGSDDLEIFTLDLSSGVSTVSLATDTFTIRKVSADTVGAILELVKRRIATNGQVVSGDVVGEIRFVGKTDSGSNPVAGKIIFTADETQTDTNFGGTLSIQVIPEGQAALVEHMKFADGIIESLVPQKINAKSLVAQSVATSATISQLSATKTLVEMTGATATDIQGINSTHASKVVTIHNRSSAVVTLKHNNGSASANDRLYLPGAEDLELAPEDSTTLIYSVLDSKWKAQYKSSVFSGFQVDRVNPEGSWVAPAGVVKARLYVGTETVDEKNIDMALDSGATFLMSFFRSIDGPVYSVGANTNGELASGNVTPRSSPVAILGNLFFSKVSRCKGLLSDGTLYSWGPNTRGQIGDGTVAAKSSPVAVLGGLKFRDFYSSGAAGANESVFAIDKDTGFAYAWGRNANGQLGVGNVTDRSSPVAVLGGIRFSKIITPDNGVGLTTFGLTPEGILYAWGLNTLGVLGLGDVVPRSSPVAVLGGLRFKKVLNGVGASAFGLTFDGALYAWGANIAGQLGVGDTTPRSSPVAVLGGITFQDICLNSQSNSVLAIDINGNAYAWGDNTHGQLGVGNVTPRSSPVLVLGSLTFKKVDTNFSSAYGITTGGVLYAWGRNNSGQLGLGDVTSRSSPVAVLGSLGSQDFVADGNSIISLTENGILYAWGANANGQLGLGDVTPRSSPVAVLGSLKFKPITKNVPSLDFQVVPSTSYSLKIASGRVMFGNIQLPSNTKFVDVEYYEE